jgi:hypothetical protein
LKDRLFLLWSAFAKRILDLAQPAITQNAPYLREFRRGFRWKKILNKVFLGAWVVGGGKECGFWLGAFVILSYN